MADIERPRERGLSRSSVQSRRRVVEAVEPTKTIEQARLDQLVQREADVEARRVALEAGEPVVRLAREPRFYSFHVSTIALSIAPGGDCRPEALRESDAMARLVYSSLWTTDRKRYQFLHRINSLELPTIDPPGLARANLLWRGQEALRTVVNEGFIQVRSGDGSNEALIRMQSRVEDVLSRDLQMQVDVELHHDAVANVLSVAGIKTLRRSGINIDTRG